MHTEDGCLLATSSTTTLLQAHMPSRARELSSVTPSTRCSALKGDDDDQKIVIHYQQSAQQITHPNKRARCPRPNGFPCRGVSALTPLPTTRTGGVQSCAPSPVHGRSVAQSGTLANSSSCSPSNSYWQSSVPLPDIVKKNKYPVLQ